MGCACCKRSEIEESELTLPFVRTATETVDVVSVNGDCDLIIRAKGPNGSIYLYATLADTIMTLPLVAQQWLDDFVVGKTVVVERTTGKIHDAECYGVTPINLYCDGMHINQELAVRGWAHWVRS